MELFANINWFIAIPLGLFSLQFFILGIQRINRFYFYEYGNDPKEGFPDIFLGIVDLIALSLSLLMAISPPKLWMVMIPCGSSLFLFAPFFMLREDWNRRIINERMTEEQKSLANKLPMGNLHKKISSKLSWQEYSPIAFITGVLTFFLVNILSLFVQSFYTQTPELDDNLLTLGAFFGIVVGLILMLIAYYKSTTTPQVTP